MRKILFLVVAIFGNMSSVMAQSVTLDVPSGYKVVVVPSSVTVSQATNVVTTTPQTVYVAPAPVYHKRARHVASVAEGMVIEHQHDAHN